MAENGITMGCLWTFCAYRRHESLPLRLLRRPGAGAYLFHNMVSRYRADTRHPPHLGATARPDRHAERIEVPRVEYDKLSDNCNIHRLWESSKD